MVSYVVGLAKVFCKTYTCSYKNTTIGVTEKINFKISYYLTSEHNDSEICYHMRYHNFIESDWNKPSTSVELEVQVLFFKKEVRYGTTAF